MDTKNKRLAYFITRYRQTKEEIEKGHKERERKRDEAVWWWLTAKESSPSQNEKGGHQQWLGAIHTRLSKSLSCCFVFVSLLLVERVCCHPATPFGFPPLLISPFPCGRRRFFRRTHTQRGVKKKNWVHTSASIICWHLAAGDDRCFQFSLVTLCLHTSIYSRGISPPPPPPSNEIPFHWPEKKSFNRIHTTTV